MLNCLNPRRAALFLLAPASLAVSLALAQPAIAADLNYHVSDTQVLGGDIKWDYLAFDATRHRLFITRGGSR